MTCNHIPAFKFSQKMAFKTRIEECTFSPVLSENYLDEACLAKTLYVMLKRRDALEFTGSTDRTERKKGKKGSPRGA